MNFHNQTPIYLQIAEYIGEQVLVQNWKPDDKVLSIRELAVQLEVNPNTVQRTYDFLQTREVIYTKRGLGYFVTPRAEQNYLDWRREAFVQNELPIFFKQMRLLNMSFEELEQRFNETIKKHETL
ncbi:MAG: GntR family transcriptional regulator [Runella slithyformis]|nr:MAG: GntR family transcriptional regulator [Runella slithyformis]TAF94138.1 MAG: GntR family transcriptional regulator [Runella sp.]TAG17072.1 MAG: GntR family transcriptional regulator [Cytophagales bacterium]TAG36216.1 MAG: GntR family transcriptional regulator [Cytophagia bacterium]TAG58456.1 MAG: GntR family transcriptional regulator [Runella slithyformis]